MKRWHILLAAGFLGVASLLVVPFEVLVHRPMPTMVIRALASIQPAILTALAVLIGEVTARRVGLRAPLIDAALSGERPLTVLRRQVPPALAVAIATAVVLLAYNLSVGRTLVAQAGSQSQLASFDLPLAPKLLYGGITEELLTRWGLVSLFAWIGWRLTGKPEHASKPVFVIAIGLSALLFAAGHLPLLFMLAPHASVSTVAAVVVANAVPGCLFGWLYVRSGLEAAILAHMTSHLIATALA